MKHRIVKLVLAVWICMSTLALAAAYDDMLHAIDVDDQRSVADLLRRGVDVDTVNPKGESLLMLAARSGKPAVVKTLLAARPKIDARNAQGETALMLAAISAVLPFVPEQWLVGTLPYLAILGAPVLWIVAFWGASHFSRARRWWLWFAAPFALKSVAEGVAAILFWLVRGFAP